MNQDRIFCGNGKTYDQYGNIGVSVCIDNIPKEHITIGKNGRKYVRLKICTKRQPDQFGNTHSVEVNAWRPDQQQQNG